MCGLIGMAGHIDAHMRQRIFPDMLHASYSRGRDATGVAVVYPPVEKRENTSTGFQTSWCKQLGGPTHLVESANYDRHVGTKDSCVLIGHTRAKTVGLNVAGNAHPFEFDNVLGAHNGTLEGYYNLPDARNFDVDSEVLYNAISEMGVKEAIPKVGGAWCLTFWDKANERLCFLRNSQRPLWFGWFGKNQNLLAWASEPWMLSALARKIDPTEPDKSWFDQENKDAYDMFPYFELPEDELWTFQMVGEGVNHNRKYTPMLESREVVKGRAANFQSGTTHHYGVSTGSTSSKWSYDSKTGTYTRDGKPAAGGEVASPFQGGKPDQAGQLGLLLPPGGTSQEESVNTPKSSPAFLLTSAKGSDSKTSPSSSTDSVGSGTSAPSGTSETSRQTSNGGNSSTQEGPGKKFDLSSHSSQTKLETRRTVAGLAYIFNTPLGMEMNAEQFNSSVSPCCSFCKQPHEHMFDVGLFITPSEYLCLRCVTPTLHHKTPLSIKINGVKANG